MRFVSVFLFAALPLLMWAQGTYSSSEIDFEGHTLDIHVFVDLPDSGKNETTRYTNLHSEGPFVTNSTAAPTPGSSLGYFIGFQIFNEKGKIAKANSKTEFLDLEPGSYLIRCWSDSTEIESPAEFKFQIKPKKTIKIELVFRSSTLKFNQIDQSLFE